VTKDPCASRIPDGEDWSGDGIGLDNDGDLLYDEDDPDCFARNRKTLQLQISPNPVTNSGTEIAYVLPARSDVSLRIFDITGHVVLAIDEPNLAPGRHRVSFSGRDASGRMLASGIYFVAVESTVLKASGRIVLLR
jgi:hypothetical protein